MLPLILKDNTPDFTGVIYVYKIVNNINDKFYIGVHKNKTKRIDKYMGSGLNIKRAIEKYGVEKFTKEILKEFETYDEALKYEKELVTQKEVDDKMCYNMKEGGLGGSTNSGRKHSIETKQKISDSRKGKSINANIAKTTDHKLKISKSLIGKIVSVETRLKMSNSKTKNK